MRSNGLVPLVKATTVDRDNRTDMLMDRRSRYLYTVIHAPRVAMALAAACTVAWYAATAGWDPARGLLVLGLLTYPFLLRGLLQRPFAARVPMLALVPDWVAAGLCIIATGASPTIGLAFGLAVVMPAVVLGGLLWGTAAFSIVAGITLLGRDVSTLAAADHQVELIGQFALVACLSVVAIAIYEHQQGVIQRVSRARQRADNATTLATRLSRYVAPTVFAAIRTSSLDDSLTTDARELTVFFADIEGFTELTERLPAGVVTQLLNDYLDIVSAMADKHGGIVDKFMGDGVLIFFDDTRGRGTAGEAAACACMALEMRDELALLREVWRAEGMGIDLRVRMGVHTGLCRIGNFGSAARMDYTVIGTPVNIASRLEGAATSDQILVSDTTHTLIADSVSASALGTMQLKGIRTPVHVHALLGQATGVAPEGHPVLPRGADAEPEQGIPAPADAGSVAPLRPPEVPLPPRRAGRHRHGPVTMRTAQINPGSQTCVV